MGPTQDLLNHSAWAWDLNMNLVFLSTGDNFNEQLPLRIYELDDL